MALQNSLLLLLLLVLPIFLLPPTAATSSSSHHHLRGRKSLHFTFYQHETVNKTAYIIVNGVTGPGVSQTTAPFGTLYAFQDPMTSDPSPASRVVGTSQGTSIISSLDGLNSMSIARISLNVKNKYKGTVSIVGVTHNIKLSTYPIVGGTGDFLFAQGCVISSQVDLVGLAHATFKIEFHIYWPPYATPNN